MTSDASQYPPRRRFRGRLPAFLPVPLRGRGDGWTVERQGAFIGLLAETGSVSEAARRVGMSRKGAYQLRSRPGAEGFAAAWDVALGSPPRKVTGEDLARLAFEGTIRPVMRAGRYRGLAKKSCDSALLRLLDRLDRAAGRAGAGEVW
ncbi:MAG: hypothetical protein PHE36_10420 [Novosphingobium sp.]|nr:hypothetical protein [Novosphingobium sp.]